MAKFVAINDKTAKPPRAGPGNLLVWLQELLHNTSTYTAMCVGHLDLQYLYLEKTCLQAISNVPGQHNVLSHTATDEYCKAPSDDAAASITKTSQDFKAFCERWIQLDCNLTWLSCSNNLETTHNYTGGVTQNHSNSKNCFACGKPDHHVKQCSIYKDKKLSKANYAAGVKYSQETLQKDKLQVRTSDFLQFRK